MARELLLDAAANKDTPRNQRFLKVLAGGYQQMSEDGKAASHKRYTVDQLADNAKAWDKAGRPLRDPKFDATYKAMQRYVTESTIMPDPTTRPALGNDPRFAALYHLSAFYYAFGTHFLGGLGRETMARAVDDGNYKDAAAMLALAGGLMLPAAMVGLEIREGIKWGARLGGTLVGLDVPEPEMAFMSDRMDTLEYMLDIADRSGLYGPFTVASSMAGAWGRGDNLLVSQVPIAELMTEVFVEGNLSRAVPVAANVY